MSLAQRRGMVNREHLLLLIARLSRAAAKHTTVAKRKCTTGVMGDGSDLGVSGGTGTVGSGPWED